MATLFLISGNVAVVFQSKLGANLAFKEYRTRTYTYARLNGEVTNTIVDTFLSGWVDYQGEFKLSEAILGFSGVSVRVPFEHEWDYLYEGVVVFLGARFRFGGDNFAGFGAGYQLSTTYRYPVLMGELEIGSISLANVLTPYLSAVWMRSSSSWSYETGPNKVVTSITVNAYSLGLGVRMRFYPKE